MRDRWPFLNEPDCPLELQAMVTQRITDYHQFTSLYSALSSCSTTGECAETAGMLLDAYFDSKAIGRELDYYQKHRRVLGRHPYFRTYNEIRNLRSKTTAQLYRERDRTKDNIWRVKSEIKKGDKPHLFGRRAVKLKRYQLKLHEINRLLGEIEQNV